MEPKSEYTQTLKKDLQKCLKFLSRAGTFAVFDSSPATVNPGINVRGLGTIGLPLSDRDAKAIFEITATSFTGADSSSVGELTSDNFELRNQAWTQALEDIVQKAIRELGVDGKKAKVRAELSKMLLFGKHARFGSQHMYETTQLYSLVPTLTKVASSSSATADTFGTLAICLPSKHEGGEITLSYRGEAKTFETAKLSDFDLSFMAWYVTEFGDDWEKDSVFCTNINVLNVDIAREALLDLTFPVWNAFYGLLSFRSPYSSCTDESLH
jgi:hypothetical protein